MKSTKLTLSVAIILVISFTNFYSCKKDIKTPSQTEKSNDVYAPNFVLAKTNSELTILQKDPNANLIRSLSAFDDIVNKSALSKLTTAQLADFRNSLVVKEGTGIVAFKTGAIDKILSYDDFANVMAMFGLDTKAGFWGFSKAPDVIAKMRIVMSSDDGDDDLILDDGDDLSRDYKGYYCIGTNSHTCKKSKDYICLSGCS